MPFCPICETQSGEFRVAHGRAHALCPVCGSLERHRLDWLFLRRHTDLFSGTRRRLLQLAPEPCLSRAFSSISGVQVLTADLDQEDVDVHLDLTSIPLASDCVDVVYCSHVLEHIENDRRAIAEIQRIVRPGGWALLQVPIKGERTWESPEAKSPEARLRLFGQRDHVRICGPDYAERYRDAGFRVQVFRSTDVVTREECGRFGFQQDRYIFYCWKPADSARAANASDANAASEAEVGCR